MEKGTRVVVVAGRKAKGVTGTVFWTGPSTSRSEHLRGSWGPGPQDSDWLRLGVRGDDGETHWLNAEHVEALEPAEDPGPAGAEAFEKGDQVSFEVDGAPVEGEVFWIGENKYGPGQRLGVRDRDGDTHWLDAVRVTRLG